MFGRKKTTEPGFKDNHKQRIGGTLLTALALTGLAACKTADASDGPVHSSTPPVVETTPNATPDVTLAPTSTIDIPSTSSEVPTSSSETETPAEQKLYVENPDGTVSFPVANYYNPEQGIDKREQLVKDFLEVGLTSWANAGATTENTKAADDIAEGPYLRTVAEANKDPFADDLFKDWNKGGTSNAVVNSLVDANEQVLRAYALSEAGLEWGREGAIYKATVTVSVKKMIKLGNDENPFAQADVSISYGSNFPESSIHDQNDGGYNPIDLVDGTTIPTAVVIEPSADGQNYQLKNWLDYAITGDNANYFPRNTSR